MEKSLEEQQTDVTPSERGLSAVPLKPRWESEEHSLR
jgi:hypothetical protein